MRSPACLLTLCLAACVQHCGCLRNRAAADAVIEQAQLPTERKERRASLTRWMSSSLLAAVLNGEQLAPLLFGRGAGGGVNEMLGREEDLQPGCDEEDGVLAKAAGVEWKGILDEAMKEMADELGPLAGAQGGTVTINIGDAWAIQKASAKVQKHLRQKAPGACRDSQTANALAAGDLSGLLSCVHQATNISKKCLRCVPRFVHQLGSECATGCTNSLSQARTDVFAKIRGTVIDKLMPSPAEILGAPATHEELVKRAHVMKDMIPEVFESLSIMVPCVSCARQRTGHLFECLNVETAWREDVDSAIRHVEEGLRDGTLINVTGIEVQIPEPTIQRGGGVMDFSERA